jgi:hypothetical protein
MDASSFGGGEDCEPLQPLKAKAVIPSAIADPKEKNLH